MLYNILILSLMTYNNINFDKKNIKWCWYNRKITNNIEIEKEKDSIYGTLTINKINLYNKPIYNINSKNNNINKNIMLLKDKDIIILIAHSGVGPIAYFKDLDKLQLNDKVILNNESYKVFNIYEEEKDGTLEIKKKDENELILTTCSYNKGKQLIIETKKAQ